MAMKKDILKKIRKIEISTGRLVNDVFAGQYESVFKGRGMEFSEVREYQPGDDIRLIDWNVTARYGKPFVKKFSEERELTVMLMVDASGSSYFGSRNAMKYELSAELAAVLAFSALRNNDKVGMIFFTDRIERFIPPKKGRSHILGIIREILLFSPGGKKTDIAHALEYLNEIIKRKAIVFILSDFLDTDYERLLSITNKKHDVVALTLNDPLERSIPPCGIIRLNDAETGKETMLDAFSDEVRSGIARRFDERFNERKKMFNRIYLDHIDIWTHQDYVKPLIAFFRRRARRFR